MTSELRACWQCGRAFVAYGPRAGYCSVRCKSRAARARAGIPARGEDRAGAVAEALGVGRRHVVAMYGAARRVGGE